MAVAVATFDNPVVASTFSGGLNTIDILSAEYPAPALPIVTELAIGPLISATAVALSPPALFVIDTVGLYV